MAHFSRHYTLDEARGKLPEVRARVRRIRESMQALERSGFQFPAQSELSLDLQDIGHSKNGEGKHSFPPEYLDLITNLHALADAGIQVKSAQEGLVDFPAFTPEGEEVFLCYLEGEPDILYWHPIEGGFRGRQPVEGTFLPLDQSSH